MDNNFNLYHIFYTVAKCHNISAAANELFISQPAISKAISKLESSLETQLFTRSSRGVALTPEGDILFHQVEKAFQSIHQGEEQLKKASELGVGKLSIGVSTTLCKFALLPYLKTFILQNPHIKIFISCQSTSQTITALENEEIDIGLIGEATRPLKINYEPFAEIQDTFVTTPHYLENLKARMNVASIKATPANYLAYSTLILLDKNNLTRQYVDKYLNTDHLDIDQIIEVTSMDLLIEFVKTGLGIGCVIKNFIEKELANEELIRLKMPVTVPKRKIGFAYTKSGETSKAVQTFLHFINQVMPS